jgi:hypothetical protein
MGAQGFLILPSFRSLKNANGHQPSLSSAKTVA